MPKALVMTVTVALTLIAPCSGAEVPADLQSRVKAIVAEQRARAGTPAMSVAVIANGRIVVLAADGLADVENRIAATPQTVFQAASLTKLLTASLVMHEVEAGRLALDVPVNTYLPAQRFVRDAEGQAVRVTLRHLLSHASGLPFGSAMQTDPRERPLTMDERLANGLRTIVPPEKKIVYASDGFVLAGWLAARTENASYDDLIRRVLFEPLGMSRSSFKLPREYGEGLAVAYDGEKRMPHVSVSGGMASGALLSTAEDLGHFAELCLARGRWNGAQVLSTSSMDSMMQLGFRMHPKVSEGFGLGFAVRDAEGRKVVWWDGQLPGTASRLALLPEHNVGVVVLANRADNNVVINVANAIFALLVPPQPVDTLSPQEHLSERRTLAGVYRVTGMFPWPRSLIERFANVTIKEIDGKLILSVPLISEPREIIPLGQGLFRTLDGANGIVDGDRLLFSVLEARRVPPWKSATAWFIYAGLMVIAIMGTVGWSAVALVRRFRRA